MCYCKVKLFRDHGAERKLSNDIAHVCQTIKKLKQQIAQAEQGMDNLGKRKRSWSVASKGSAGDKPGKVPKHKKTWSTSSLSDHGGKLSTKEDLAKLATIQHMFSSARPVSVLYLRGDDHDDPDLFPVHLSCEDHDSTKMGSQTRQGSWESKASGNSSPATSNLFSATSNASSINSANRSAVRRTCGFQQPVPFDPVEHGPVDLQYLQYSTSSENQSLQPAFSK